MYLYHCFTNLYNTHFARWWRFVAAFCVFLFSQLYFAQSVALVDSTESKLTLQSGAQIFSSDDKFNQQVAHVRLDIKKVSKKVDDNNEVLLIISAQSISVDDKSKQASVRKQNVLKKPAKKNVTIVNVLAVTNANSKKYNFQNSSSHSRTFSQSTADRVFINFSNLSKHYADASIVQSVFYIQRVLSDLHFSVCCHCNSAAYDYRFAGFYPVRPPPLV
ncbi:hypothetical protein ASG21_18240 [Chryseobacterium sp. Leaf394]|nr:hypothetical protein ASG21_18240 [Chryseobacterium sp. Leaf394]